MDPRRIGGFATEFGGPESHTAIMARALGLPAVLGVAGPAGAGARRCDGGDRRLGGHRDHRPDARDRRGITASATSSSCASGASFGRLRRLPAVTRDGIEIRLEANLELPVELDQAVANGAMGLGLVRTEFLYMNREDLPSEDEQYEFFASLVRGMEGRPVTLRTLDVGGDKLPEALAHYAAADVGQPGARAARHPPVAAASAACSTPSSRRCCAPPGTGRCASCCR